MKNAIFRYKNGGNDRTSTLTPVNDCGVKDIKVKAHKRVSAGMMSATGKFTVHVAHEDGRTNTFNHFVLNMNEESDTVKIVERIGGESNCLYEIIGV